MRKNP